MAHADIHIHLLFGVDDGAKDEDEMHAILDAAYQAGTRVLCCGSMSIVGVEAKPKKPVVSERKLRHDFMYGRREFCF